jgi:LPPG:FO 2-phospho-L-lactate transferase
VSAAASEVLALSGGVGGAKLALGLSRVLAPDRLTVVVNTGDDQEFHGLHVSPDVDTVVYTLAGLVNPETGWGLASDSFHALEALSRLGADAWFRLGDRDLATHLRRTELLESGWTLSRVTEELCRRLGVASRVVPATDGRLRTVLVTDEGDLAFQTYFVRRRCEPKLLGLRFDGAEQAGMSPGFERALGAASCLVWCPSNPWLSVEPILAVPGARDAVERFSGPRVAVSPIVGGKALKGPAAKIMAELGYEPSSVGIARYYRGLADVLVIDRRDEAQARAIGEIGLRAHVTETVMQTLEDKIALAKEVAAIARGEHAAP